MGKSRQANYIGHYQRGCQVSPFNIIWVATALDIIWIALFTNFLDSCLLGMHSGSIQTVEAACLSGTCLEVYFRLCMMQIADCWYERGVLNAWLNSY